MYRSALTLLSVLSLVNAHAALTNIAGGNGVTNVGLGVQSQTPNQGQAIRVSGNSCGVGNTAQALAASTAKGIATPDANGNLNMQVFIINGDGGGPYTCALDTTGTGNSFNTPLTIKTNVGNNVGQASSLVAAMPAGTSCPATGCIVQCKNNSGFGGCVPVASTNNAVAATGATGNTGTAATGNTGNTGNNNGNAATANTGATTGTATNGNTGATNNGNNGANTATQANGNGNGRQRNGNGRFRGGQNNRAARVAAQRAGRQANANTQRGGKMVKAVKRGVKL